MIHYNSYKFRIYPNCVQCKKLKSIFGACRFVYNYFLNQKTEYYHKTGKTISRFEQCKLLSELKKQEEYKWLNDAIAQSLQGEIAHLDSAFQRFFNKKGKYPNFKKAKRKNTFYIPQHFKIINNRLYIPKFKNDGIKIIMHRPINGKISSITIIKTPTDKYYASLLVEEDIKPLSRSEKEVGIDLGIKDLIVTSDGCKYSNPKFLKKYEIKLKKAQRHLSRKQKGSRSSEKQRRKVALIHEKITNCRKDNLHKITKDLVSKYDVVYMENLNAKGMLSNHVLAKAIGDSSFSYLQSLIEYKTKIYGKQFFKIDRWFPSTKACSSCGYIMKKIPLNIRTWTCPHCGIYHDRDINAAKNILKEGKFEKSAGAVDNTNGGFNENR